MVLDAHADCIDEDGDHNPSVEVLAFNDTPKLHSYFIPDVFTFPETGAFILQRVLGILVPPLFQVAVIPVGLLQRTLLFLPIGRMPRRPLPLLERQSCGTLWTLLWVWGDGEGDGVL